MPGAKWEARVDSNSWSPVGSPEPTVAVNDGTGAGIATFTGVSTLQNYHVEAYFAPTSATPFGDEFWGGQQSVGLVAYETTSITINRSMPYSGAISAYQAGVEITSGDVVAGSTIEMRLSIINPGSASQNVKGRLLLDRDKSGADYDLTSGSGVATNTDGGPGSSTITPATVGEYYFPA